MKGFIKTILAFIIINISVLVGISLIFYILSLFWIHVNAQNNLLLYSIIVGSFSSIISLLLSPWIIKRTYNIYFVWEDITDDDPKISYLKKRIDDFAEKYWYKIKMWIYESSEPNAFAAGCGLCWWYMVAFSTWILEIMDLDELDWVLWHELSHIYNQDVVLITILQSFLDIFVIYISHILSSLFSDSEENNGFSWFLVIIFETIFWIIASIILAFISRKREFKADYYSATKFSSKQNMIKALKELKDISSNYTIEEDNRLASLKFNNFSTKNLYYLFSTHPKLEERIKKLESI